MSHCRVCGNKLLHAIAILVDGEQQEFDCLECAKQALAPSCMHCGCFLKEQARLDRQHTYYCCEDCAEGCEIITNST